jgi:hypothetical protein
VQVFFSPHKQKWNPKTQGEKITEKNISRTYNTSQPASNRFAAAAAAALFTSYPK